jgi:hypothetical protein
LTWLLCGVILSLIWGCYFGPYFAVSSSLTTNLNRFLQCQ